MCLPSRITITDQWIDNVHMAQDKMWPSASALDEMTDCARTLLIEKRELGSKKFQKQQDIIARKTIEQNKDNFNWLSA